MSVQVVCPFAPRPNHEKWMDYLPLLRLQRDSALKFGHEHLIITDDVSLAKEFNIVEAALPQSLMRAMIAGNVKRLSMGGDQHIVFLDADCLVNRKLDEIFTGEFDLGLTRRENVVAPINNGAMYVDKKSIDLVYKFFVKALSLCGDHWGADQEAISAAIAPVPEHKCIEERDGMWVAFLSMRDYAGVPKKPLMKHHCNPYIMHFKGATKSWMEGYVRKFH